MAPSWLLAKPHAGYRWRMHPIRPWKTLRNPPRHRTVPALIVGVDAPGASATDSPVEWVEETSVVLGKDDEGVDIVRHPKHPGVRSGNRLDLGCSPSGCWMRMSCFWWPTNMEAMKGAFRAGFHTGHWGCGHAAATWSRPADRFGQANELLALCRTHAHAVVMLDAIGQF